MDIDPRFLMVLVIVVVALLLVFGGGGGRRLGKGNYRLCRACGAGHPAFARYCRRCGKKL
jgi:hypothetical protein